MVNSKKSIIFQGFIGGPTFFRGPSFSRGPNANFYRNPYDLCFPGVGSGPLSSLWIRACKFLLENTKNNLPS